MSESDQESAESINTLEGLPSGTHAVFMALAAVAVLGMMGFVLGYGVYGKVVTADLDDACARSAFLNGQKFQELGNYDRAILRYRQAMKGHFNDPEDRHRCGRAIGDLLFEQGRFPEAITAYKSLPEAAFGHAGAYTAFVTSLWRDNQLEEAEALGRRWLALAEQENSDEQVLWSNNVLFRVAHAKGRYEEAMELGAAMVEIDPATDVRLVLAQMLHEQGKDAEAVRQITQFMEKTEKTRLYQQARAMKRDIEASIQ